MEYTLNQGRKLPHSTIIKDKKVVFSQTLEPSFSDMFMIPREEGTEFHVFQEFALDIAEVHDKDLSNNNKLGAASLNDTTVDVSLNISHDVSFNNSPSTSIKAGKSSPSTVARPKLSFVDLMSVEEYLEANRNKNRFVVRGGKVILGMLILKILSWQVLAKINPIYYV